MDEKEKTMALAYGWLWHITTEDRRIWAARRTLMESLTKENMAWGIEEAKKQGAVTTNPWRA